jgi:hypothetical protein
VLLDGHAISRIAMGLPDLMVQQISHGWRLCNQTSRRPLQLM